MKRQWSSWIALPVMALLFAGCIPTAPTPPGTYIFEDGVDGYAGFADTSIFSENEYSGGASDGIFSGTNAQLNTRRALIRVDLSSIPAGSVVTSATLSLTVERSGENFGNLPFTLHRVTRAWGEGRVVGRGEGGFGAPADEGDATWIASRHRETTWTSPGGDYAPEASATAASGPAGATDTWSGPGMAADVQAWVDNPNANFGWILISTQEGAKQRVKKFYSSEATRSRPRLVVTIENGAVSKLVNILVPSPGE
ncbi:MAG: DNRLRE domain-containing protein [Candidatus Hydrogenedens sp.]|nr:DNRLRE domain-containing protein [Candidatus Hydrogenedens sp.]